MNRLTFNSFCTLKREILPKRSFVIWCRADNKFADKNKNKVLKQIFFGIGISP